MRDYYQLLEVTEAATIQEIQSSFRRLSKQWHPDINKAPEASEKFKRISQAYDWLKTYHRPIPKARASFTVDSEWIKAGYSDEGEFHIFRALMTRVLVNHSIVIPQGTIDNQNIVCHCFFDSEHEFAFRIPRGTTLPTIANVKTDFGRYRITILSG